MKKVVRNEIKDNLNNVIIKETNNGKNVYRTKNGTKIEVCPNELSMIVACGFEPLERFLEIPPDNREAGDVWIIAEALCKNAKQEIEEAVDYIEANFGMVNIERAMHNQEPLAEEGKILGVEFIPAGEGGHHERFNRK